MKRSQELSNYYLTIYANYFQFKLYRFSFERLFRGRSFAYKTEESTLREVSEFKDIWTPPPNFSSKQRCNEPGNSILYLASHESTLPHELKVPKNEIYVVCRFLQTEDFLYVPILGWERLMKMGDTNITNIIKDHFIDKSQIVKNIDKEVSERFTSVRFKSGEDIYDHTIGLSNLFFAHGGDGLIYPSVADNYKSLNLALIPDKVQFKLRPIGISMYRLLKTDSNESIDVEVIREGYIDHDSKIHWSPKLQNILVKYKKNVP